MKIKRYNQFINESNNIDIIEQIKKFLISEDEYNNIQCSAYILGHYNEMAGSWFKASAYYNVGPTGYNTNRKMKKQGKRYAKQVKQHRKDLKHAL